MAPKNREMACSEPKERGEGWEGIIILSRKRLGGSRENNRVIIVILKVKASMSTVLSN